MFWSMSGVKINLFKIVHEDIWNHNSKRFYLKQTDFKSVRNFPKLI